MCMNNKNNDINNTFCFKYSSQKSFVYGFKFKMRIYKFMHGPGVSNVFLKWPTKLFGLATPDLENIYPLRLSRSVVLVLYMYLVRLLNLD